MFKIIHDIIGMVGDNMASAVIHMAVASEINKTLKRDNNKLLIGTIAPDISKFICRTKVESHFLESEDDNVPNLEKFLIKYKDKLNDDFVMGYFIHLFTDYLWFKYFVTEFYHNNMITKLDGTIVECKGKMLDLYIYNDYTNLNTRLLDEYNLDLKIFYNELPEFENIIEEIPMDKINIIVNQMAIIIQNSRKNKDFIFNIENVKSFIELSTNLILAKIIEINEF